MWEGHMLMRYSKGHVILIPFILTIMLALAGCAQEEASGGVTDVTDALFLSGNEDGAIADTEGSSAAAQKATSANSEVSEITSASKEEKKAEVKKLTDEECRKMELFLNDEGSYGFLLSVYEKPQDLDAEQVFYIGAGLAEFGIPEEEREAYLEETGKEEAPNLFRLSSQQISDHLQYRAGISLEELSSQPDWVYLEDYDAYYQAHGDEDTNICRFEVTDAAVQGDYYRVHYREKIQDAKKSGRHMPVYETILKKNGDSYRFCANRLWMEKGLLLRPYCKVTLEPYGEVSLCAYKPDKSLNENADVTFELIKDGKVTALPGLNDENIRSNKVFEDVVAVDAGDYDEDGMKEIMAICRYQVQKHGSGREDGLEARIYRFSEDGEPKPDWELSNKINQKVKNLTLSGAAEFIKTGKDRDVFASREEAYAAEIKSINPKEYDRFALIYVNDDRMPELLEMGTTPDKGARIIFYNNGLLEETKISGNFSYLSKENLLYCKNGTQILFDEALYVYAGNRFGVYLSGTYGTMDAAGTSYTQEGKPEYTYTWEGSLVTEAGYQDAIGFVYNRQRAVDASKIKTVSAEELLAELKSK